VHAPEQVALWPRLPCAEVQPAWVRVGPALVLAGPVTVTGPTMVYMVMTGARVGWITVQRLRRPVTGTEITTIG
jgi:hypothetical protein